MFTMTIFVAGSADPPDNLTLEGAYSFNNGKYIGSVSATSPAYAFLRGATFVGNNASGAAGTLTITY